MEEETWSRRRGGGEEFQKIVIAKGGCTIFICSYLGGGGVKVSIYLTFLDRGPRFDRNIVRDSGKRKISSGYGQAATGEARFAKIFARDAVLGSKRYSG